MKMASWLPCLAERLQADMKMLNLAHATGASYGASGAGGSGQGRIVSMHASSFPWDMEGSADSQLATLEDEVNLFQEKSDRVIPKKRKHSL